MATRVCDRERTAVTDRGTAPTAIHDGRRPFVDPAPLARWAFGDTLPDSALGDALRNKTIFMSWFNSQILARVNDTSQCSSALLLYFSGPGAAQAPRNQYFMPPGPPFGFSSSRISVLAECPDFVFPIGQVASHSNVTRHDEFYPVTANILAARGCDGLLVRLAQDLTRAGILSPPRVGRTIAGGEILMRRRTEDVGFDEEKDAD